jgi:DNA-binding response OmpR family regulator
LSFQWGSKLKANILVVEDDDKMRAGLEETLRERGFRVATAENGTEALRKINEEAFDLVLTDLMMPGIDGMDVLREVKKHRPATRVIMITAYGTIDSAVEAMKHGASDYLVKPFGVGDVVAKVGKVLEEARFEEELSRAAIPLRRDAVLKSLANPTRLSIVDLLDSESKLRFVQIRDKLGIKDPTKLSFHLRNLKSVGILEQDEHRRYFLSEAGKKVIESIRHLK